MIDEPQEQQTPDPEPSGDPSGEQNAGQKKGTEPTVYVVYEAQGEKGHTGAFAQLVAIGAFTAPDEAGARWQAVDSSEALTEQAAGTGAHLLALPASRAQPKLTKEVQEVKKVRK